MKTVLKVVIGLALLNAVIRGADASWNYYQLKDAAQRTVLFGAQSTSAQIHAQIMATAADLDVPLKPEDLSVRTRTGRRVARATYTQPIEFFPNYQYPVTFSFSVDATTLGAPDDDSDSPR